VIKVIAEKELKNYLIVLEIFKDILKDFDKSDKNFYPKIKEKLKKAHKVIGNLNGMVEF